MSQADSARLALRLATEATFGTNPLTSTVAITAGTNAAPIVLTSAAHGFRTGMVVEVASVGGLTNANGVWEINVLTANTFELVGSQGNAAYTAGGTAKAAVFDVRFTGEGLTYALTKARSNEIRDDRQSAGQVLVDAEASGPLNFELSYKELDWLLASALQSQWVVYGHRGQGAAFDGTFSLTTTLTAAIAPTGASAFTNLKKGQWVTITGSSITANNKLAQISKTTAPTTTVIVFEGTPFTNGAAGAACRVNGSRLTNGVTARSWAIEKDFTDIVQIEPFNGMEVDTLSLNFQQGAIATGSVAFKGKKAAVFITATAMSTPQAANTYDQMNAVTGVSQIQRDGVTITEYLTQLSINIANNARTRKAIGNLGPVSIGYGRVFITGGMEAFLQDGTRFDKHVNNTAFATSFAVQDSSGNGYVVTLTRQKFTDANPGATSPDQDVMDPGAFDCEFDSAQTEASGLMKMIFIDRVGAAV